MKYLTILLSFLLCGCGTLSSPYLSPQSLESSLEKSKQYCEEHGQGLEAYIIDVNVQSTYIRAYCKDSSSITHKITGR